MDSEMEQRLTLIVVASVLICIFVGILYYIFAIRPINITKEQLTIAARTAKIHDLKDGYMFENVTDYWGERIVISREVNPDKTAVIYTAYSPGKDGRYDTEDDMKVAKIDFNKSKIIGKWTAKKMKEFAKGFVMGDKEESKFEK